MRAIHSLLHGLIDYAGLFPPATLTMTEAVAGYSSYRAGPHCWALGRFVVPVARLAEFECDSQSLPSRRRLALEARRAGRARSGRRSRGDHRFQQPPRRSCARWIHSR